MTDRGCLSLFVFILLQKIFWYHSNTNLNEMQKGKTVMGYLREMTDLTPEEWELLCSRMGNVMVRVAHLVLKVVALFLAVAAVVCAVVAYWDKLSTLGTWKRDKMQKKVYSDEYEDFQE